MDIASETDAASGERRAASEKRAHLPTERARAIAETVRRLWAPLTDEERMDVLAIINAARAPLSKEAIENMLASCGTIALAAQALGVARRTLQKRMRVFKMDEGKRGRRPK